MDALKQAIHNGADAVYLAGSLYGARSYAKNFTDEEMKYAIEYAHKYGVRINVTVNTLILDTEMKDVIKYIRFLISCGVDALIIQDIGLAYILHNKFPGLEIHGSTQMHNLDDYSAKFLEELGFSRIIMAREVSLEDINKMKTKLDVETFIHGALCMSYSGECLFSSVVLNRSGNRGKCAQCCRMPYELLIDSIKQKRNPYMLSLKDLNTTERFEDILKSRVYSFKIEGRMKSPEYVGLITRIYRKLMDNPKCDVSEDINKLQYLFNRGFTLGNLFNENDCLSETPNHQGVEIGKVIDVTNKIITIKLSNELNLTDGIKFKGSDLGLTVYNLYKNNEQVKVGKKGEIVTIPNTIKLKSKDIIVKTTDSKLLKELATYDEKRIPLDIDVFVKVGKPLKMVVDDIVVEDGIVQNSINNPLSVDGIKEKLNKTGDTVYSFKNINIELDDNAFIPVSIINKLRREILEKVDQKRVVKKEIKECDFVHKKTNNIPKLGLIVNVKAKEQFDAIKDLNIGAFITNDKELYDANKSKYKMYLEVGMQEDNNYKNERLLVNNTSDYTKYKDSNEVMLDYGFNVYNSYSLEYFNQYYTTLSPELTVTDIEKMNITNNAIFVCFGKLRLMTMKHCLVTGKQHCNNCGLCDKKIELKDTFGNIYPVKSDRKLNYIYNCKNKNYIDLIDKLKKANVNNFRIDLLDEDANEALKIVKTFLLSINK